MVHVDMLGIDLDDSFARALPELSTPWSGDEVRAATLIVANEPLAGDLGLDLDRLASPEARSLLVGRAPDGLLPVAQAYAGHQFGHFVPRLGDGRALLLGEFVDASGHRRDLHLKGSGPTPFARGGDGKAVVGAMLREYVIGEGLHALGIPTTRALAVVSTGESVWRDGETLPGAVLARVAASHLRVGSFQYAASRGDVGLLARLADHAIQRHYPTCADTDNPYLQLLAHVVDAQADLVARWMSVGFVHGVLNTDNTTISGESIDFGPCAFLDVYHPDTVFSSIDRQGRYAFGNQPAAVQWNLARLAETFLPLIDDRQTHAVDKATRVLEGFASSYENRFGQLMAAKMGLAQPDRTLTTDLLDLLATDQIDFTGFFRALAAGTVEDLFSDAGPIKSWLARREELLPADRTHLSSRMDAINPVYIARNHVVEHVLAAATAGECGPLNRLVAALRRPFDEQPGMADLARPAPQGSPAHITYCGT